jgi:hypothetical protein
MVFEPLPPSSVLPSVASEGTPEREREIDDLLRLFQEACEDAYANGRSEDSIMPTAKHRAILRNDIRARLLSVDQLRADLAAARSLLRDAQQDTKRLDSLADLGQFMVREGADGQEWAICDEDWQRGVRRVVPLGAGIDLREAIDKAMSSRAALPSSPTPATEEHAP